MNKLSLAMISFGLGICCTLAASRILAAGNGVNAQISFGPNSVPVVPPIIAANPIPVVQPLKISLSERNAFSDAATLPLDGLISRNDSYNNVIFEYGGGAYRLIGAKISGRVGFRFIGAAANTITLLDTLGLLVHEGSASPNPSALPSPRQMNKPRKQKVILRKPLKGDIASPFDGLK